MAVRQRGGSPYDDIRDETKYGIVLLFNTDFGTDQELCKRSGPILSLEVAYL